MHGPRGGAGVGRAVVGLVALGAVEAHLVDGGEGEQLLLELAVERLMSARSVFSATRVCRYSMTMSAVQMTTSETIQSTSIANLASVANISTSSARGTTTRAANPRRM